jgi:hypothetical protein
MQLHAASPAGRPHGNALGIRSERHRVERVSQNPSLSISRGSPDGDTATVAPGIRPRQCRKCRALAICCIDDTYSDILGVGTDRIEHSVLSARDDSTPREPPEAGPSGDPGARQGVLDSSALPNTSNQRRPLQPPLVFAAQVARTPCIRTTGCISLQTVPVTEDGSYIRGTVAEDNIRGSRCVHVPEEEKPVRRVV